MKGSFMQCCSLYLLVAFTSCHAMSDPVMHALQHHTALTTSTYLQHQPFVSHALTCHVILDCSSVYYSTCIVSFVPDEAFTGRN